MTSQMSDDADDGQEAQPPVVLQCRSCRRVVGDSQSWGDVHDDNTIWLHKISSMATVGACKHEKKYSYLPLSCECGQDLGRLVTSTPSDLDHLRNLYGVTVSSVTLYEIGGGTAAHVPQPAESVSRRVGRLEEALRGVERCLNCELRPRLLAVESALNTHKEDKSMTEQPEPAGAHAPRRSVDVIGVTEAPRGARAQSRQEEPRAVVKQQGRAAARGRRREDCAAQDAGWRERSQLGRPRSDSSDSDSSAVYRPTRSGRKRARISDN